MFWKNVPELASDIERVKSLIRASVDISNDRMRRPLMDFVERDSKLLRPGLLILSARILSKSPELPESVYNYAASFELLHMASLLHDDIIDNAYMRRGALSINEAYGVKDALLVGDLLFCAAAELIYSSASSDDASVVLRGLKHLVNAESSELDDAESVKNKNLRGFAGRRRYLRRIVGKTALLFVAAMHVGAREVCDDKAMQQLMRRIGYDIGVSFQMMDDVLDLTGDNSSTGKMGLSDLREAVAGYPLVVAANSTDAKKSAEILRLFYRASRRGPLSYVWRRMFLSEIASFCELAKEDVAYIISRAKKKIALLPSSVWRDVLFDTVDELCYRVK